MNQLWDNGREGILDDTVLMSTDTIKAMLIKSAYTFSGAHKFVSDIVAGDNGRSAALASKTFTAGVFNAANSSLLATAAAPSNAVALYKDTGVDSTSRIVAYLDTRFRFTVAVAASTAAVAVAVDPLLQGIANAAVATKISGAGPATITLAALAAQGARSLTTAALGAPGVSVGDVYEVDITGSNFPFTPSAGQTVNLNWNTGSEKIFKL